MFRGVFVGLALCFLSGCATSTVLGEDKDKFESEAHRAATVGAAVVVDAVVTPIIVAAAVKEATDTVIEKVVVPVILVGVMAAAITHNLDEAD